MQPGPVGTEFRSPGRHGTVEDLDLGEIQEIGLALVVQRQRFGVSLATPALVAVEGLKRLCYFARISLTGYTRT